MRSSEIFARMEPGQAERLLAELREEAPETATLALGAAAQAFKLRPQFLRRQPRARQAEWMRRSLARTTASATAEDVLASYFLDVHRDLLVELLDALGVEHEEGALRDARPECPEAKKLRKAVKDFRKGEEAERRELLLRAFAAQSSIDWPELEKLLEG